MKPRFIPNAWYLYENGDYKEIFYAYAVDGEYLMQTRSRGYSSILCRRISNLERKLRWNLIKIFPDKNNEPRCRNFQRKRQLIKL